METIILAAVSVGLMMMGVAIMLLGTVGLVLHARRREVPASALAPTLSIPAGPVTLAQTPRITAFEFTRTEAFETPAPAALTRDESDIHLAETPRFEADAASRSEDYLPPAALMDDESLLRDTQPQPAVTRDIVAEILAEEYAYAMAEDEVATSVRPEVRIPSAPPVPAHLPFSWPVEQTRVTRAADYMRADSGPLPMPVPPPNLEPIPELEPTQLMAHQPDFA